MFPGISREKIKNRKQNKLIKNLTTYKSRYFYIFVKTNLQKQPYMEKCYILKIVGYY